MENANDQQIYVAFLGGERVAQGSPAAVALALKARAAADDGTPPIVFDMENGRLLDMDLRGSVDDIAARYGVADAPQPKRRGRPKLGVEGKEVTLLPRHWAWLEQQRGGPSATLRRLVDQARSDEAPQDLARRAQDRTQRFMYAVAGDQPGFEEAIRALYAGDGARFEGEISAFPKDVRQTILSLVEGAF
ncbi:MAG: DUF2239 family protein [Alphaproteobacteria bacterium]